jgi:hypothetical protein
LHNKFLWKSKQRQLKKRDEKHRNKENDKMTTVITKSKLPDAAFLIARPKRISFLFNFPTKAQSWQQSSYGRSTM